MWRHWPGIHTQPVRKHYYRLKKCTCVIYDIRKHERLHQSDVSRQLKQWNEMVASAIVMKQSKHCFDYWRKMTENDCRYYDENNNHLFSEYQFQSSTNQSNFWMMIYLPPIKAMFQWWYIFHQSKRCLNDDISTVPRWTIHRSFNAFTH